MKLVLFLCSANFYRSRFAEHVFNWLAGQEGLQWKADSRGLAVGHWGDLGGHLSSCDRGARGPGHSHRRGAPFSPSAYIG